MTAARTSTRRRWPVLAVAGLASLAVVAVAAWRLWWPEQTDPLRPLVLVVSADTEGFIIPCGCTSNQSGGLPRRATYVSGLRESSDVLVLDAGGAPAGTSEYDRAKFSAILRGALRMGLAVHNIGRSEALLGADYLKQAAAELQAPFVSTNLTDQAGQPIAPPFRIVPCGGQPAGRNVAVMGILSPKLTPRGLRAAEPREAVLAALSQAKQQGRLAAVVVLAYAPPDELSQLAEALPEIDVIVGGPTGQSMAPRLVGPTLLAAATNKGKFIAQLEAPSADNTHWSGKIVELTKQYADDAAQSANLREFYAVLAERDFSAADTSFIGLPSTLPADYRVAGTNACQRCHTQDCQTWQESKHAHAWETLATRGSHVDSYCQQCHTTGFGLPGGFVSAKRSAAHTNIGCESCHGPSQAHADRPETRTAFFGQAAGQCVRCHDRENSPTFAYDSYWEQIAHGVADRKTDRKN